VEYLVFKSFLFMHMVRLVLFQPFPLEHVEEKIKPFSTIKLVIIKMAYSSKGTCSSLLRQERQK